MTALVFRVERIEPVGVEIADHIPHPVLASDGHLRDRGHVHPLRGQQHHLRPPPGHHRPRSPADDPHQPPALVIVDLTHPHTFSHRPSLRGSATTGKTRRANVICYGTSSGAFTRFETHELIEAGC